MLYKYTIVKMSNPLYIDKPTLNEDIEYTVPKTEKAIPKK